ncbi:MAG: serine hydroxymethyltransferase, partial [Thermoplasmata archaeon]|nr:serine hydroxymethyltransferase [Thermoplasmata archaeon]
MTIQDSKIMEKLTKHEQLRSEGLNLIASENYLSDKVRAALASDLGGRYHTSWYGGAGLAQEIITATEELAKKVFNAKYAFVNPLSGNLCDLAVLYSFTEPDDK